MSIDKQSKIFMDKALEISMQGLGDVWPNPSVGCLVVKDDKILGQGRTEIGGTHAEISAMKDASDKYGQDALEGASLYVTLEPCSHHGRTAPCVDAIIKAKIKKVFIATKDPFLTESGIDILRNNNIEVIEGLLEERAKEINKGFLLRVSGDRPLVMLKIVTTLDGRIATSRGESQWISCDESRRETRLFRSNYDGILTGIGTVISDNPSLTCRQNQEDDISETDINSSPLRIVLDSNLRISEGSKLVQTAKSVPLWIFTKSLGDDLDKVKNLEALGVKVIEIADMDLKKILSVLAKEGITRLLVEGGPAVWTSFLEAGLVDEIMWVRFPGILGGDGLSALHSLRVSSLKSMPTFKLSGMRKIGESLVEFYTNPSALAS